MTNSTDPTTVHADPKVAAVGRLYAAYGRGDVAAVLAELADAVDWAAEAAAGAGAGAAGAGAGAPWWGPFDGKAAVPRFFAAIAENVAVTEFDVVSLTSNETDVVATVHWTFTVNATGKTASMYMQHWFRFAADKIVFFRGSEDTAQSAAAFA